MFKIEPEIKSAETLPSEFYRDKSRFLEFTNKLTSISWQLVGDTGLFRNDFNQVPVNYLEGLADEPLLLCKVSDKKISCLSNVCTHRGNLLVQEPRKSSQLLCGYHGRRFNMDGNVEFMPEFEDAVGYPRSCDHLTKINADTWDQFIFVNIEPNFNFSLLKNELDERVGFMNPSSFVKDDSLSKEYFVNAHWALYCDNFLEGFHIPFVHPGLNQAVEYSSYKTELFDFFNLQVGYSKEGVESFNLPESHKDYGNDIAAYYYWVFPNLMLNFYPWGLSVNMIQPIDYNKTKVTFIPYIMDKSKLENSAGAALDQVEMEDEAVVESVQKGMQSRFYKTGRFSPTREQGVHHFHGLISEILSS